MKVILRILLFLSFIILVAKPIKAKEIFRDDFYNLSENNWLIFAHNNSYSSYIKEPHYLYVEGVDNNKDLFLSLNQKISELTQSNNITIEIRFKFIDQFFGSGIAINDKQISQRNNRDPITSDYTIIVWPLTYNKFGIISSICLTGQECPDTSPQHSGITSTPIIVENDEFNQWHVLKIKYNNSRYEVSLDNNQNFITTTTTRKPNTIWLGSPQITNTSVIFSRFLVDYVKIYDDTIEFPYFSQKDPLWSNDEYDQASQWAQENGIERWGCALTSAAMVLNYYGVNSPTGETTTPKVLNDWLKSQPDGYIKPGLLNWLAVTRYAKLAQNNGFSPTDLEFKRENYQENSNYALPSILGIPGHFVVAYNQNDNNFFIKDPADIHKTELAKTESIQTVNTFTPTHTDLSYFMFVTDPEIDLSLKDASGSGVAMMGHDEFLQDDIDGTTQTPLVKVYTLAKPQWGKYVLSITNTSNQEKKYSLGAYYYDAEGQVGIKNDQGWLDPQETSQFEFEYAGTIDIKQKFDLDYLRVLLKRYKDRQLLRETAYGKLDKYLRYAQNTQDTSFKKRLMKAEKLKLEQKGAWFEKERRDMLRGKVEEWL